ncbi:MAG: UPF0280 family protein [Candidatus Coatesbacteria bacterium]|nr:UPF0280 family protein [Candidatus Coatesbacteria bacterium]
MERFYRNNPGEGRFITFTARYLQTDLWIAVDSSSYNEKMKKFASERTRELRHKLDAYIDSNPSFQTSLEPLQETQDAPPIAIEMIKASQKADVGPMAAVAGAFSERIARDLLNEFMINEIIVENGGDIWLYIKDSITLSVYAGKSPLSGKIGLQIDTLDKGLGICTSSATVGHSLSFGKADAVTIVSWNAALADAYATSICNMINDNSDVEKALDMTSEIDDIISSVIIIHDKIGINGIFKIKLL